jgi:MFS family permease
VLEGLRIARLHHGVEAWRGPVALLAAATAAQLGASMIQQGTAVIAAYVRQVMHVTLAEMGAVVSAMSLGMMAGMTISGVLVDSYGPRRVQGYGAAGVVGSLALAAAVHTYLALLVALFCIGVFLSAVPTAGTKAIFNAFPDRTRGLMMGIRQTGVPFGSALAALILPWALAALGLSGVWLGLTLPVAAASVAFCLLAPGPRRGDLPERRRLFGPEFYPAFFPMLVGVLLVAGQYSALTFTIPDLHTQLGWPLALGGVGLAVCQIGGGLARIVFGVVSDRLGGRRALVIGGIAFLGCFTSLAMAWLPRSAPVGLVLLLLFLFGAGTIGWNSLNLVWAGELVPTSLSGQAMGWAGSVVFLGSAIYPPLFGHVVDLTHAYPVAWTSLAVLLFGTALLALLAARRTAVRRDGLGAGGAVLPP